MRERGKIERRIGEKKYEVYREIDGKEPLSWRGLALVWLRGAIRLGLQGFICGTTLVALTALGLRGITSPTPYGAVIVAGVLLAVLTRGQYAEAGKQRGEGPAKPGNPRASPRKARASPGHEPSR